MSAESIWIASGMGTAIVAMALYIKALHKHSTEKLTDVLLKNSESHNQLAEAIRNIPDKILVSLSNKK